VDARYLTQKDRDAFKLAVIARRDAVGRVIARMEARGWYGDDAVLHDLRAAWHALHAAVQALTASRGPAIRCEICEPGDGDDGFRLPPAVRAGHFAPAGPAPSTSRAA
jgi:hypothetical protein